MGRGGGGGSEGPRGRFGRGGGTAAAGARARAGVPREPDAEQRRCDGRLPAGANAGRRQHPGPRPGPAGRKRHHARGAGRQPGVRRAGGTRLRRAGEAGPDVDRAGLPTQRDGAPGHLVRAHGALPGVVGRPDGVRPHGEPAAAAHPADLRKPQRDRVRGPAGGARGQRPRPGEGDVGREIRTGEGARGEGGAPGEGRGGGPKAGRGGPQAPGSPERPGPGTGAGDAAGGRRAEDG